MGLDILINTVVSEIVDCVSDLDNALQENEAKRILATMDQDKRLATRPGSYGGIHVLRCAYARMKGWKVEGHTCEINNETGGSHLISHSDCDGYYLPDDFVSPQWFERSNGESVSVGSSVKLLSELTELLAVKDQWPEGFQWRWDAVFVAAVASIVCREVITFG